MGTRLITSRYLNNMKIVIRISYIDELSMKLSCKILTFLIEKEN